MAYQLAATAEACATNSPVCQSLEASAQRTTKITWLPPRDFDFRKRPIGNSGAFFGSAILHRLLI
jgi:hypothetical protein